jgi:hypothetical protein
MRPIGCSQMTVLLRRRPRRSHPERGRNSSRRLDQHHSRSGLVRAHHHALYALCDAPDLSVLHSALRSDSGDQGGDRQRQNARGSHTARACTAHGHAPRRTWRSQAGWRRFDGRVSRRCVGAVVESVGVARFEDKVKYPHVHGPWVYPELLAALKLGRQGVDMSTRGTQSYGKAASIHCRHCPREPWRETKVEMHRVCLICVSFCAHVPSRNETASVPDRRQPQAYSTWFTT